ncbi:LysR family transcriptional regulator [Paraburkholderia phenazinium]|uniref:DNA-binding transcriptional regulator, LysR family n=1 Tax=Paraburkholderia phenazinium TaxID=60549 RepID=A0A1G7TSM9_9BURK|nr:LysR family transcriptional regulator [Paraburkholderia phenazinium]SDG37580.1 DNA-binding transcriptional regulator, LysR family [Paraburkholderia phenazinium]
MDRLTAMETFVCVVDSGSFSAAARLLNVGQPAVSKSIAQLEERLAVRLLLRSTRGLTPTEAGHAFYERAKRAIEEADEAEVAARGSAGALSGRLRISAAVTFARIHIVPHLQTFLDRHPELNVDIVLDDENIDLLEHGIDVAIRIGVLGDSSMTARKVGHGRRCVVGTPAWFAKAGEPRVPADLLSHQAIVYEQDGGGNVWSFRRGDSETAVAVAGRVRVNAAEGVRAAVLADMGVAIASEWMFAPEIESGAVKRVLADWELPGLDLWAVFPSGRMVSAKARAFVAWVEELCGFNPVVPDSSPGTNVG